MLLHDAVRLAEPLPGRIYRLRDGHSDLPPQSGSDAIDPSELLDLIFTADSIVIW